MIRIEFVKDVGGITHILNGTLRDTDRNNLDNIENVDKVRINALHFSPIGFNYDLKAIELAGYVIIFDSLDSMQPYLDQIDIFDGQIFNPGINGIQYPSWDVGHDDKYSGIQPHTYVDTDVEND